MNLIRTIVAHFHGRCDHAMRAASDRMDAPLAARRRAALALHLWTCEACARATRQLELTRRTLAVEPQADPGPVGHLDEPARQRIAGRLRAEKSGG